MDRQTLMQVSEKIAGMQEDNDRQARERSAALQAENDRRAQRGEPDVPPGRIPLDDAQAAGRAAAFRDVQCYLYDEIKVLVDRELAVLRERGRQKA